MIPYINIHSHHEGNPGEVTVRSHRLGIGEALPGAPYSAGVHPWDVEKITEWEPVWKELREADIVAVGEIGLDYNTSIDRKLQSGIFSAQLDIASGRGVPVIVHCVKAFEEVMRTAAPYSLKGLVFHSFTGSKEQVARIIKAGYYISLSRTSLNSSRTIESMRKVPLDRIFLETDDDAVSIGNIFRDASEALNIPMAELKRTIYDNYRTLLGKS